MLRAQLRDLCHRLFRQLNCNVQGMAANALHKAVRNLHLAKDHRHLFSIPASVFRSVLGWMAWNFNVKTSTPIGSVPGHEHAGEQWAEDCKRAFIMIDLNPSRTCTLSQTPAGIEVMQTEYPALRELQTTLKAHSGTCASVTRTREGLKWLYGHLGIGNLTDPEPEDFSLRDHTEATCCICKDNTQDRRMENGVEVGEMLKTAWLVQNGGTQPAFPLRSASLSPVCGDRDDWPQQKENQRSGSPHAEGVVRSSERKQSGQQLQ